MFYQSRGNKGVLDVCLCLGCGGLDGEWHTQQTRQTDTLTEQHKKYKDITSHSLQLRSKRP